MLRTATDAVTSSPPFSRQTLQSSLRQISISPHRKHSCLSTETSVDFNVESVYLKDRKRTRADMGPFENNFENKRANVQSEEKWNKTRSSHEAIESVKSNLNIPSRFI